MDATDRVERRRRRSRPQHVCTLPVFRTTRVTPRMMRVTLGGPDLHGFEVAGPDERIKLFFPHPGQDRPEMPTAGSGPAWTGEQRRPITRTYTVRRFDPHTRELDIDFVLHGDHGPASAWAARAEPGQWLGLSGPRGDYLPEPDADWHLLVGDETALPAISVILESLPAGARAFAYVEIANAGERQDLRPAADVRLNWLDRANRPAGAASPLLDAVRAAELPAGRGQAWVSGEAGVVRDLRRHLLRDRGLDRHAVYPTGYWRLGHGGSASE